MNVNHIVRLTLDVDHSNGPGNIVVGGRRASVNMNLIQRDRTLPFICAEKRKVN